MLKLGKQRCTEKGNTKSILRHDDVWNYDIIEGIIKSWFAHKICHGYLRNLERIYVWQVGILMCFWACFSPVEESSHMLFALTQGSSMIPMR